MDPLNSGAVGFVNGERWLSPFQDAMNTPKGTYYFSRRFQLRGGLYTIKIFVDDAATLWVGKRFDSAALLGSWLINQGTVDTEIYLPSGSQRLDFIVQNLPAEPSPAGFIFSLWQDGALVYVTTPPGWLWDTKPIPDEEVPDPGDPRRAMVVLSTLPNWQEGIIERLSWLTDVMTSETGAEQRRPLRDDPRRSFEMNFLRQGANRTALDAFLTGVGKNEFLLPLFHEAITMTDGVDAGAGGVDFIQGQGSEREWTLNDLAMITNGDPGLYEVLKVGVVNENGFLWVTPPERTWPPGTRIYPLREARLSDSSQLTNVSADVGQLTARFDLSNPMRVADSWLANINGVPLFPFIPDRAQAISGDYTRLVSVLDNQTGRLVVTDISEHTAIQLGLSLTLFGRHKLYQLRQFLAAARGRSATFIMPTFADDLVPVNPDLQASNILVVRAAGLGRFHLRPQSARSMIGITMAGDDLPTLARGVLGIERQFIDNSGFDVDYTTDVWYDRLMLDSPLPALPGTAYKRISWLSEARFAQDEFEFEHVTSTSRATKTAVSVRQLRERRMRNNVYPPAPKFPPLNLQPTGPITARNATVQDVRSNVGRCEAAYSLREDGVVETVIESTGARSKIGVWLANVREANLWEVRAMLIGGNGQPYTGDLGAWQNLGGMRKWSVRSDENGRREIQLQLEYRDAATKTIRATNYVTLVAFPYA